MALGLEAPASASVAEHCSGVASMVAGEEGPQQAMEELVSSRVRDTARR